MNVEWNTRKNQVFEPTEPPETKDRVVAAINWVEHIKENFTPVKTRIRVVKSKKNPDVELVIHETIITDIKPLSYYQKCVETSRQQ